APLHPGRKHALGELLSIRIAIGGSHLIVSASPGAVFPGGRNETTDWSPRARVRGLWRVTGGAASREDRSGYGKKRNCSWRAPGRDTWPRRDFHPYRSDGRNGRGRTWPPR